MIGHLFAGRYKAKIVSGKEDNYFRTACNYVHLNPASANLVQPGAPLKTYRWSSFPAYLWRPERRPPWLRTDRLLGTLGIPADTPAGRREFERIMTKLQREAKGLAEFGEFENEWCWGDEEFRSELLLQVNQRMGENHYGPECLESDVQKAERIIQKELNRIGWSEEGLKQASKFDSRKVGIAQRLRVETTSTLNWIAQRLAMGHWRSLANRLRKQLGVSPAVGPKLDQMQD